MTHAARVLQSAGAGEQLFSPIITFSGMGLRAGQVSGRRATHATNADRVITRSHRRARQSRGARTTQLQCAAAGEVLHNLRANRALSAIRRPIGAQIQAAPAAVERLLVQEVDTRAHRQDAYRTLPLNWSNGAGAVHSGSPRNGRRKGAAVGASIASARLVARRVVWRRRRQPLRRSQRHTQQVPLIKLQPFKFTSPAAALRNNRRRRREQNPREETINWSRGAFVGASGLAPQ